MNIKEVRKEISELLIKWGMPTRQIFINELLALIEKERASAVKSFVEKGTEIQQDLAENGVIANIGLVYEEYLKTLEPKESEEI